MLVKAAKAVYRAGKHSLPQIVPHAKRAPRSRPVLRATAPYELPMTMRPKDRPMEYGASVGPVKTFCASSCDQITVGDGIAELA